MLYTVSMPTRPKILILNADDFMREIIGNLLHKKGYYIINARCINDAVKQASGMDIKHIIMSTNCDEFKGKQSINFLNVSFSNPDIFIINESKENISYLPKHAQVDIDKLSIQNIINYITDQEKISFT